MGDTRKPLDSAVEELKANLDKVARVSEWAELMGYSSSKRFSRHFLVYFHVRLRSIVTRLHENNESNCVIAWLHSLPDEKALYNFVSYHLKMSPTDIRSLTKARLQEMVENLGSEF